MVTHEKEVIAEHRAESSFEAFEESKQRVSGLLAISFVNYEEESEMKIITTDVYLDNMRRQGTIIE